MTNIRRAHPSLLVLVPAVLLTACVSDPTEIRDPGVEKRALRCAHDETLTCTEKMGKTISCTCSNRDDLRDILEPEVYDK